MKKIGKAIKKILKAYWKFCLVYYAIVAIAKRADTIVYAVDNDEDICESLLQMFADSIKSIYQYFKRLLENCGIY